MNPELDVFPEWDSNDAKALKDFFASDIGRKVLTFLSDAMPLLLDGGDVNKTLVRSGEVKGFSLAVDTLLSLTTHKPSPLPKTQTYPDLDDDSAWEDQNKKASP